MPATLLARFRAGSAARKWTASLLGSMPGRLTNGFRGSRLPELGGRAQHNIGMKAKVALDGVFDSFA